jgi:hypothetical protein
LKKYDAYSCGKAHYGDDAFLFANNSRLSCYCGICRNKFQKLYGKNAPIDDYVKIRKVSGIVPDEDTWLQWMEFRSKTLGNYYDLHLKLKNEISPDLKLGTLPGDVFLPTKGMSPEFYSKSVDLAFYYAYPKIVPYHATNVALMLGLYGKDTPVWALPLISNFSKDEFLKENNPFFVRNEFFTLLSAGASGQMFFAWGNDNINTISKKNQQELSNLGKIIKKYGDFLIKFQPETESIALLASFSTAAYQSAGPTVAGKPSGLKSPHIMRDLNHTYMTLLSAGLPSAIIFERDIRANKITKTKYKYIFLTGITVLRKSVYDKLVRYIKDGGTVICDNKCKVKIPGAKMLNYNLAPDYMKTSFSKEQTNLSSIQHAVTQAKELFKDKMTPSIVSNNVFVYGRKMVTKSGQKIIILLNNSLCSTEKAEIKLQDSSSELWNIMEMSKLKFSGNKTKSFRVELPPGSGILIYCGDNAASMPMISTGKISRKLCSFNINMKKTDGKILTDGLIPISIKIINPSGVATLYSQYATVLNGSYKLQINPGLNDSNGTWTIKTKNLISGLSRSDKFILAKAAPLKLENGELLCPENLGVQKKQLKSKNDALAMKVTLYNTETNKIASSRSIKVRMINSSNKKITGTITVVDDSNAFGLKILPVGKKHFSIASKQSSEFMFQLVIKNVAYQGERTIKIVAKTASGTEVIKTIALFFAPPQQLNRKIAIEECSEKITIDGKLKDWKRYSVFKLDKKFMWHANGSKQWNGVKDKSCTNYICWTPNNLYLAFIVRDNKIINNFQGDRLWKNDCVQIGIDAKGDNLKNKIKNDMNDFEWGFANGPGKPQVVCYRKPVSLNVKQVKLATSRINDKVIYEIVIPYQCLGLSKPFSKGQNLGYSFAVNESDNGQFQGWLQLTPGIVGRKDFTMLKKMVLK